MTKKYILTDQKKEVNNVILYQIQAIRSFGNVKKGELGGYVASKENLSHKGDAWVGGNACIFKDAQVFGNAQVYDYAKICSRARVCGNAKVYESASVHGSVRVSGEARLAGTSLITGDVRVFGSAYIYGNPYIYGSACIGGHAAICSDKHLVSMTNLGFQNACLTAYKSRLKGVEIIKGDFHGTIEEFEESIRTTYQDNQMASECFALIDFINTRFK